MIGKKKVKKFVFIVFLQSGWNWISLKKVFTIKKRADSWAKKMQARVPKDKEPIFDDYGQVGGDHYFVIKKPLE